MNVNRVNKKGETALFIACKNGNTEIAELLLAAKAKVNITDKKGLCALYLAAKIGCSELVKILITNKVCLYRNNLVCVQGYNI